MQLFKMRRKEKASIPQLLMPPMGSEHLQNLLKYACTLCPSVTTIVLRVRYGQVFGDIHSVGTARRAQALPCPSTGTPFARSFPDFQHACTRGGGALQERERERGGGERKGERQRARAREKEGGGEREREGERERARARERGGGERERERESEGQRERERERERGREREREREREKEKERERERERG